VKWRFIIYPYFDDFDGIHPTFLKPWWWQFGARGQTWDSVCHSVCVQDYCKSNRLILLKLGIVIGPTNRKNCLTFGGDPIQDMHSKSLFAFPHHCGRGDVWRFISSSHTITGRFSRDSAKWLTTIIHDILAAIQRISRSESRLIRKSGFESRISFRWG